MYPSGFSEGPGEGPGEDGPGEGPMDGSSFPIVKKKYPPTPRRTSTTNIIM